MTRIRSFLTNVPVAAAAFAAGCTSAQVASCGPPGCDDSCTPGCCSPGAGGYGYGTCGTGGYCGPGSGCLGGGGLGSGCLGAGGCHPVSGWLFRRRTFAVPDTLPLGSTVRAHYHTMETNAEASDFILHRGEFVYNTAELTPAGKDHIVEIAARAKAAPFPVLVERSLNNSDPELDARRRNLVAQVLTDFGLPEANQRTIVSPAYGRHPNSMEAQIDYYQFLYTRGGGAYGGFGNGGAGGFGGGAGGSFGGVGGAGFF
jgi:hypothetical protein